MATALQQQASTWLKLILVDWRGLHQVMGVKAHRFEIGFLGPARPRVV